MSIGSWPALCTEKSPSYYLLNTSLTRRNGRVTKKALLKTVSQYESCEPPFVPASHTRVVSSRCPQNIVLCAMTPLPLVRAADLKDQKRLDSIFERFDTDRSQRGVEKSRA